MKIGILSFFKSINYGAVLQSLALQRVLSNMGYETLYIDNTKYVMPVKRSLYSKIYSLVRLYLGLKERQFRFKTFIAKNIYYTEPIKTEIEMGLLENQFDLFISGSDQVWNPKFYNETRGVFLLNFVKNKPKISYASSFARWELPVEFIDIYKESLAKFKAISCREMIGKTIVEKLGLSAVKVLDPTLLLDSSEWKNYIDDAPLIRKDKYIVYYSLPGHGIVNDISLAIVKRLLKYKYVGYKAVVLGEREYKLFMKPLLAMRNAGPKEFLNLFYYASHIVTNSFHGVCFAINFNKPFNCVVDVDNPLSTRITDLLSEFNLQDRCCSIKDKIEQQTYGNIDYRQINRILKEERKKSIAFLKENIKEC